MCIYKSVYICVYINTCINTILGARAALNVTEDQEDEITGWQRSIGCLKLQVILRKRTTNYRALSREMIYKDKASLDLRHPVLPTSVLEN